MVNPLFQVQAGQISAREARELCGAYLAILTLEGSPITNFYCILHYFFCKSLGILKNAVLQLWYQCDICRRQHFALDDSLEYC